jgi:nicotinamidase-related amidase
VPLDLTELVAPAHTALVLQEVQNGVVGTPSALPALAQAAADVRLVEHCARLARVARALDIPVIHCTFEALAGGRGLNTNARLFAGVRKSDEARPRYRFPTRSVSNRATSSCPAITAWGR